MALVGSKNGTGGGGGGGGSDDDKPRRPRTPNPPVRDVSSTIIDIYM